MQTLIGIIIGHLSVVLVIHGPVGPVHVVLCIVLNDLPVFSPVVVRLALHETVGWLVYVFLLGHLKLGFLFLG